MQIERLVTSPHVLVRSDFPHGEVTGFTDKTQEKPLKNKEKCAS
jgi:hypothetical protein